MWYYVFTNLFMTHSSPTSKKFNLILEFQYLTESGSVAVTQGPNPIDDLHENFNLLDFSVLLQVKLGGLLQAHYIIVQILNYF